MNTIWQTLYHTPWWVYVLFIYLINIGIRASKQNIVSLDKLFIIPALFTIMTVHSLVTSFNLSAFTIVLWILSILIGLILGAANCMRFKQIRVDKNNRLLEVPGTWSTLVIIIIIFASKYYLGYSMSVDPNITSDIWFEIIALGVSGVCAGFFIGKLIYFIYKLYTEQSVHLDIKNN
tara:strand:- start:940 stop:1470 length:531 start_codon:yes stop_codon:yes gene_type:complete